MINLLLTDAVRFKMFFLNTEAIINRGISLLQTLHQRRYWEQFTWHPRSVDDQFAV